jgi:sarcosine oxidase subunit beta
LTNVELLKPAEISRMLPQLRVDDLVGASFCGTDGFIDPLAVMLGFTARASERGARVWLETEVFGIEMDGGRVSVVQTTRGAIHTRAVVCAAGAWAAEVARLAGVRLPVTPLRRQIASVKTNTGFSENLPMVIDMSDGFHFRPDGKAPQTNILLAWPDPLETHGFKTDYDSAFTDKVIKRAGERVPSWSKLEADASRCRAGLYEMTPDHHAIIGVAPGVEGLFLVNGFSGHGVMHSPAAGRMMSEIILEGRSEFLDATPLRAERFAENSVLHESSFL